jgi:hypothetical protein
MIGVIVIGTALGLFSYGLWLPFRETSNPELQRRYRASVDTARAWMVRRPWLAFRLPLAVVVISAVQLAASAFVASGWEAMITKLLAVCFLLQWAVFLYQVRRSSRIES